MKRKQFRFEDLDIWQFAIELGDSLFDIADALEVKRLYRFAEQLRGAFPIIFVKAQVQYRQKNSINF
ncbi:four helix bundle protein [Spirosoma validum]|uniref:four helix bundle protein n=1 Tax=Spirosoma validum TaxID=2771355 RepID=UPI001CC2A4F6|nr:four helix bundle protein [Spirosoma validum]